MHFWTLQGRHNEITVALYCIVYWVCTSEAWKGQHQIRAVLYTVCAYLYNSSLRMSAAMFCELCNFGKLFVSAWILLHNFISSNYYYYRVYQRLEFIFLFLIWYCVFSDVVRVSVKPRRTIGSVFKGEWVLSLQIYLHRLWLENVGFGYGRAGKALRMTSTVNHRGVRSRQTESIHVLFEIFPAIYERLQDGDVIVYRRCYQPPSFIIFDATQSRNSDSWC